MRMNMNEDILKGKWQEIKRRDNEKWGKLTDNDLGEIEIKSEELSRLIFCGQRRKEVIINLGGDVLWFAKTKK
jgi:hypothetical protein